MADRYVRRVKHVHSHLVAGQLPPESLFGGAGFTDFLGLKTKKKLKPTRRQKLVELIAEAGLEENVKQLSEEGWTVIPDAMNEDLTTRLRARIMEICGDQLKKKRRSGVRFAQKGSLLYHGREFEQACQNSKQMLLAEYMVGADFNVWQYLCSVRGTGTGGLPVHNDLGNGLREPFHEYPESVTSLFICDDFNDPGVGGTFVVPKTHLTRRRPHLEDEKDRKYIQEHAIPIKCSAGSIAMWDGRLWHGSLPRKIEGGERVVCSYVNSRVYLRPGDDYSLIPDEVLERNPPRFRSMLGRGVGFQERGPEGGVLFGGALDGGKVTKLSREEEVVPEMDPAVLQKGLAPPEI